MEGNTERDFKRATQKEREKRQNPERGGVPQGSCAGLVGGSLTILVRPFSVLSLLHPSGTQASWLVCSKLISKLKMLSTPHICLFKMSYMCSKTHLYTMYSLEIKHTQTEALTSAGQTSGAPLLLPGHALQGTHLGPDTLERPASPTLPALRIVLLGTQFSFAEKDLLPKRSSKLSSRTSQTFSLLVRTSSPSL